MKKGYKFLLLVSLFILTTYNILAQRDPKQLKFPDLEFKPGKPDFLRIKRGVDLYYSVDKENPSINLVLIFKTGSLLDPKGKEGLSSITFSLLKSGGTKNYPQEKLEERLDYLGSTITVQSNSEFSIISVWTLKKNFEETWKILKDIISNPLFDKDRFDTEKKRQLESIRRRWDNPMLTGRMLFTELVYGKDFPEARRTTTGSISQITIEDVKRFYGENIKDLELKIALAGDFDLKRVLPILREGFRDWKGVPPKKLNLPRAKLASNQEIYVINKEDMTQAVVCMGHLGINRHDPDNVEVDVLNFIYGTGGFNSRVMREVRSHKGLAYSAYGMLIPGRDLGLFFNFCMTKNDSVGEVISTMKGIMEDIVKNPVTYEELETAKKYEQNSFVHRFDSALSVPQEYIFSKIQDFPNNYLETYIPRIKKVDERKVLEMAKRMIHPQDIVVLVVGKKSEIEPRLKALNMGEVKEIPLPKD
ncbi:MAG: M16 family metallopeptidase [Candidatus Aminicenantia bacterium]